jgi:hypothetical protein
MTSKIAILAALLAAALALPSQARAPEKQAAWLLLAEERLPTCELDGRKVPQGMSICRDGYVHTCGRNGGWVKTGKAC